MSSSAPRQLRRDQLARFLPTLEMIIAFENMFTQTNETTPSDISALEELLYSYGRRAGADNGLANRVDVLESQQIARRENLQDIRKDIADIKAFLGL